MLIHRVLEKSNFSAAHAVAFFSAISFTAIHFSPALASISLALSVPFAILQFVSQKIKFNTIPLFVYFLMGMLVWQIIAAYFVTINPGINQKIFIRLPFFALPFLFVFRYLSSWVKLIWLTSISLFILWLSAASVVHYFNHFAFLNQMVLESKPLPIFSQVYHIEFSVILAITALLGVLFLFQFRSYLKSFLGTLLSTTTVLNIVCLHLLTVRTGILCFWIGFLLFGIYTLLAGRMKWYVPALGICMALAASLFVPSIKNRITNTAEDISTVIHGGDLNNKSFGQRWEAWKASIYIIKAHPILGVGLKNVEEALAQGYEANHSTLDENKRVLPHNQYLDLAVQSGIPALILLLAFYFSGIAYALKQKNTLLLSILTTLAFAMLFESILERQSGVLVFTLMLVFCMDVHKAKDLSNPSEV